MSVADTPLSAEPRDLLGYTFTPEIRQVHSRLIHLAAELVRCGWLPETEDVIHCRSTPVSDRQRVVRSFERIEEQMKTLGIELRQIADSLPKTKPVECPPWLR